MSRFQMLSHAIWHCQYHIVWVPKYRYRILQDNVSYDVENTIRSLCAQHGCDIIELNVCIDHVHLLVMIPPKRSISSFVGLVKGKTAIRVLNKFRHLREKPYWGNHFWARGYCVDTVGLDSEMVRKYVKHQETEERRHEAKK